MNVDIGYRPRRAISLMAKMLRAVARRDLRIELDSTSGPFPNGATAACHDREPHASHIHRGWLRCPGRKAVGGAP